MVDSNNNWYMPEDKASPSPYLGSVGFSSSESGNGSENGAAAGLKLAAGMKEDPDFKVIREQVKESSLNTSPHFLDDDPNRGSAIFDLDAGRIYREKYPEKARAYDRQEKTRIYENPNEDPAVIRTQNRITNETYARMRANGHGSDETKKIGIQAEITPQRWKGFVEEFPEKTAHYADMGHSGIAQAQEAKRAEETAQQATPAEVKA